MQFAPGDTVQLKSGGPVMTIERVGKGESTQEDFVVCVWAQKVGNRQEVQREQFNPIVLEKYEPSFGFSTMRVERS